MTTIASLPPNIEDLGLFSMLFSAPKGPKSRGAVALSTQQRKTKTGCRCKYVFLSCWDPTPNFVNCASGVSPPRANLDRNQTYQFYDPLADYPLLLWCDQCTRVFGSFLLRLTWKLWLVCFCGKALVTEFRSIVAAGCWMAKSLHHF